MPEPDLGEVGDNPTLEYRLTDKRDSGRNAGIDYFDNKDNGSQNSIGGGIYTLPSAA